MDFQIDNDIPLPRERVPQGEAPAVAKTRGLIGWLRTLHRGQSILVPGKTATQVGSYMRAARRGTDKWFEARTMTNGARVWRTE